MNPVLLANTLQWLTTIVNVAVQVGQTVQQVAPILDMIKQVAGGTHLTAEQRTVAQGYHEMVSEAALRDLGPMPEGAL